MTEGWTGRKCPTCNGTGLDIDDDGTRISCPKCGGRGEEWGEIPDEPTIKEPDE